MAIGEIKKRILVIFLAILLIFVFIYLVKTIYTERNLKELRESGSGLNETNFCLTDADCVPDLCCHPYNCIPKYMAPSCNRVFCTTECASGSLDCGQGSCQCVSGKCKTFRKGE